MSRRIGGRLRFAALAALQVMLLLFCAVPQAQAHRLRVFASAEGPDIVGYAYFGAKARARDVAITITRGDGSLAFSGRSDGEGRFRVTATQRQDHVIEADAGDGHRARFTLPAGALPDSLPANRPAGMGSAPPAAPVTDPVPVSNAAPVSNLAQVADPVPAPDTASACAPAPADAPADAARLDPTALAALVDGALARQLRPLREELDAARSQERMRDAVAGIGFIIGLAGLAYGLLMRQRFNGGAGATAGRVGGRS